jgi:replication factor C small subunit
MILNDVVKSKFKKALEELPNLLIYGNAGLGKGTFAHVLVRETGFAHMWINASDETGIDSIREKVYPFATSLGNTRLKVVVFNEADSLSSGPQGAQKMLKQLMEDVQKVTRFIFLTNDESKVIDEIKSRCLTIKVDSPPAKDIFFFCEKILKAEGIKYQPKVLTNIVKKCYPDIRNTVLTIQSNVENKELVSDSLGAEDTYSSIKGLMMKGDLENIRKTLRSNYVNYSELYKYLYENIGDFKHPGDVILGVGEHLYRDGRVANKEINFMHMVVSLMKDGAL